MPIGSGFRPTPLSSTSFFPNSAPHRIRSHSLPRPRNGRATFSSERWCMCYLITILLFLLRRLPSSICWWRAVTNSASVAATVGYPSKAACRLRIARPLRGSAQNYHRCTRQGALLLRRQVFQITDFHIIPRPMPGRKYRIFLGGTSDSTYEFAGERGYSMVVPPLLPYEALRSQLDIYRASCAKHGNQPDIVWIHACRSRFDRETASEKPKR